MVLPIPRVKPFGWAVDEILTAAQVTQIDVNISLLDSQADAQKNVENVHWQVSQPLAPSPAFAGSPVLVPLQPIRSYDLGGERPRIPILLADSSTSTQLVYSGDGSVFSAGGLISPSWSVFRDAVSGRAGEIIAIKNSSGAYIYTQDHGKTWTIPAAFPVTIGGLFYGRVNSADCYLLASTAGGTGTSAVLSAATWTSALFPGSGAVTALGVEFATDSVSTIVACAQVNGESFARLFRTTDNGVTWTLAQTMAGVGNVVWNKGWGQFVGWDALGNMYASTDAITWSVFTHGFGSTTNGFRVGLHTFASAGKTIAKLWDFPMAPPNFYQSGVAISNDLGQTWVTYPLSHQSTYLTGIYGFNNRFYAVSPGFVWQSGPLATQAREI